MVNGVPMAVRKPVGVYNREERVHHRPKRCNDVFFSLLYFAHLGVLAYVTAIYVPIAIVQETTAYNNYGNNNRQLEEDNGGDGADGYSNITVQSILILIAIIGGIALVVSTLAMNVLICCAHGLISTALLFNIVCFGLVSASGFILGDLLSGTLGAVMTLLAIWFACSVWSRIPFAASNLETATRAIRANIGVTVFAYLSIVVSLLWNIWFMIAFSSFMIVVTGQGADQAEDDNGNNNEVVQEQSPLFGFIVFLFLVSYFWTFQVIKVCIESLTCHAIEYYSAWSKEQI